MKYEYIYLKELYPNQNVKYGLEGLIDWMNGKSDGQIKKVVEKFKKCVESTISKYSLLKLDYNVTYGNLKLAGPDSSHNYYLSALNFKAKTGNNLNEKLL